MRQDEQYKRTIVIGGQGVGKSELVYKYVRKAYDLKRQKVLFYIEAEPTVLSKIRRIDSPERLMRWNNGIAKYWHKKPDGLGDGVGGLKLLRQMSLRGDFNDGVLVLDDCTKYLNCYDSVPKDIVDYITDHRHYHLDLIFISHSWSLLHALVRRFPTDYVVFKSLDDLTEKDFKNLKYPNSQALYKKFIEVQRHPDIHYSAHVSSAGIFTNLKM
jgi:hypothetical protein